MIHWQNEVCGTELKTIKYSLCLEGFPCWDAVFFYLFQWFVFWGSQRVYKQRVFLSKGKTYDKVGAAFSANIVGLQYSLLHATFYSWLGHFAYVLFK